VIAAICISMIYILVNMYVTGRINKSYYLSEERRRLHKKLIWFTPFIGPLLIRGYWKTEKNKKLETITKEDREKKKGSFYESGIGLYGD
jgi:hypothetical protein